MLFQIYGEGAIYQLLGCVLVFAGLVICNELARRSKFGGLLFFIIIPIALTIYFVAIQIGAAQGASWALNNTTYRYMNGWFHYAKLYAATAGCIGFMMLKYKWSISISCCFSKSVQSCNTFVNESVIVVSSIRGLSLLK